VKIRFISEADEWSTEGAKIATPENLAAIRRVLEDEGPIILEHWFYRGSSSPDRFVFDDFEDFETYLGSKASAGDRIEVWSFSTVCTDQTRLAFGKCPDDQGRVPKKGA